MATNVINDQQHKRVVDFKVSPSDLDIQNSTRKFYMNNITKDPKMDVNRRLLEQPEVGLLIKNATYSYIVKYNYMLSQQRIADQGQTQQQQTTLEAGTT